ncbi:GreA/GreB family elongation factor [Verrucomicrobiota bacterium]
MDIPTKSDAEIEEWFLAHVQDAHMLNELIAALTHLQSIDRLDKAEACADLLQECLVKREDGDGLLALLAVRATWHENDRDFTRTCEKWLSSFFENTPSVLQYLPHSGFDKELPATECLRRLQVLRSIAPGSLCYNRTWGFGAVSELDEYLSRVVVDFKTKKQHQMSFAYAAESLQVLGDDHVLVQRHRDPEGFAERVKNEPAEVVKSVILGFGPMNVSLLQETVTGNLIEEQKWKPFWNAARTRLKRDPTVLVPAKRNEPLRVLEKERLVDDRWISSFQQERDVSSILGQIEEVKTDSKNTDLSGPLRTAMEDRLRFVILNTGKIQPDIAAHALLLADELDFKELTPTTQAILDGFLEPDILLPVIRKLPMRVLARFLPFLGVQRSGKTEELLLQLMPELTMSALNSVIDYLLATDHESQVADRLRPLVMSGKPGISMISWLCRHLDFVLNNSICKDDHLALMALSALESGNFTGEALKASNQLTACFQQSAWLKRTVGTMDNQQRRDFILRVRISPAWHEADRAAVLARLIKLFPELHEEMRDKQTTLVVRRVTSQRSYAERQALLTKLVSEDIPRNTQEIATARGYGDLSENYEYHAARERQGTLMHRRNELELMLKEVTTASFDNVSTDKAGMGTCVTLRHPDGSTERYTILGEWDNDGKLGIISSASKLAQILQGHKTGEEVLIPTETGQTPCIISDISALPDEIKAWLQAAV